MEKLNIIGYFKDVTNTETPDGKLYDEKLLYIVVYENGYIDGSKTWLEYYNILDGHGEIKDIEYLNLCEKITKEQYIEATKQWHTPKEYIS